MKLISLNCWVGKIYEPLMRFIQEQAADTDIFCFQEMVFGGPDEAFHPFHQIRGQLFEHISEVLKGYTAFAAPTPGKSCIGVPEKYYAIENGAKLGQAIFVKNNIQVNDSGSFLVYSEKDNPFKEVGADNITGMFQYFQGSKGSREFTIGNLHGLWQRHKDDTPERLEQSKKVLAFFQSRKVPGVFVGDLNLRPETESISILSKDMRNLIAEHHIQNTRNHYYKEMEVHKDYISDYAFVTKDVKLKQFQVLPDAVSDHSPLLVEFE